MKTSSSIVLQLGLLIATSYVLSDEVSWQKNKQIFKKSKKLYSD
jgi:hypothetical protein